MNYDWADEVLRWWIEKASSAMDPTGWVDKGSLVDELRTRENQTQEVIASLTGSTTLPTLMHGGSDSVYLADGIDQAKYARGILNTRAETRAGLGSQAPKMSADGLHATIWDAASKLWTNGHHAQAVQRAATLLNAEVQDRTGRHDVSDAALMQQTFSLSAPEPGKPRLRWPGVDDDLNVKAMRGGILNLAQGVFMAIRNPATHSTEEMAPQEALEQLATLSTLARWIDKCVRLDAVG